MQTLEALCYIKWWVNIEQCECTNNGDVDQEVLKQCPHVFAGVDLLHLNLCVHVAMVQEVDVANLYLRRQQQKLIIMYGDLIIDQSKKCERIDETPNVWYSGCETNATLLNC